MSEQKTKVVKLIARETGFINVLMHSPFDAKRRKITAPINKAVEKHDGDIFELEVPLITKQDEEGKDILVPKIPRWCELYKGVVPADPEAEAKAAAKAEVEAVEAAKKIEEAKAAKVKAEANKNE